MAITVSELAAAQIKKLIETQGLGENPEAGLRIGVRGGGCSGLTYTIRVETQKRAGDKIFGEDKGVRVYVDLKSFIYLNGTELDFEQTLMYSGFRFRNPNVKKTCGCGESFTV